MRRLDIRHSIDCSPAPFDHTTSPRSTNCLIASGARERVQSFYLDGGNQGFRLRLDRICSGGLASAYVRLGYPWRPEPIAARVYAREDRVGKAEHILIELVAAFEI